MDAMIARNANIDLNLLTALDALLEEQSVTAAADRLGLSGPAMSRALGRIRRTTGDPVLVRAGRHMVPTPRALEIRAEVRRLVEAAQGVLAPSAPADPAQLARVFTINANDLFVTAVGPRLVARVAREAPQVVLRFLGESYVDLPLLRDGAADLELGVIDSPEPEIVTEELFVDRNVAVVRDGHPLTTGTLTARRFADASHLNFSRRGRLTGPVDAALAARGLRRKVIATVPTFTASLMMVRDSDAVGLTSERAGAATVRGLGLRTLPIPLELPPMTMEMAWHPRQEADAGHRWLRGLVRETVREAVRDAPPDEV
ncbi:LysR family transcriptional regulator [Streptomyces sp. Je 1-4]|uniref:LysR family transcriptional regulator n=2 Tax=Streptomyces TaxID=1883 RepID=UPI0021D975E1|nr:MULTISPECIES: LysR family transcriptional regulator [unclassified Streptomyces]UYB43558.1 LysR family transcriptional regulator [Streptomyces sp. Je 1-4]UZQ39945.1 LysR family transcriptional regulator [Streptomyces sp. Je 1-4] [Streptomyces sp. Je 1-4 4N24]UZQ47362.1 LysR family transcriptional regulator [Streptomyces sp. Je 1-4] [Streptomyces sp. Je 1-4 4N24_ara]